MPDLETLITETIERAVLKAFGEVFSTLPSGLFSSPTATSDDEVMGVPALAEYLGIGQRQAYQLVNCDPPNFPVKRVGTRILIVRGAVRRWLEAGGESTIAPMRNEVRKLLNQRRQISR
jgi:hypothetical protein